MRAIVQSRYGPPESVELQDVPVPEPKAGEVLIRNMASSVNAADIEILSGWMIVRMASPFRPASRVPGSDVAGVVERVGPGVTELAVGDEVMGDLSEHGYSAFAEYAAASVDALRRKPPELDFEQAAAVPSAAWVAIKGMREIEPGWRVLISGAGGSMGTFAVQMAAARGAHVTGVDSAAKLSLIEELGAKETIDYATTDPTRSDERYDLVLDVFARRSVRDWRRILTPTGSYRMVGGSTWRILSGFAVGTAISRSSDQTLGLLLGWPHSRQDMDEVNELLVSGAIRPVIDRTYPLEDAATAMRRVKDGLALGKVVISIGRA